LHQERVIGTGKAPATPDRSTCHFTAAPSGVESQIFEIRHASRAGTDDILSTIAASVFHAAQALPNPGYRTFSIPVVAETGHFQ